MVWDNLGVKKDTKEDLRELKLEEQRKRGKEISYDELINDLIENGSSQRKKKEKKSLEDVFMKL
jgi:hypothetical protein